MNQLRENLGLPTLALEPRVQAAAEGHSEWMAFRPLAAVEGPVHYGPQRWNGSRDRMMWEGIPADALFGENVARGSFLATETFVQWLNSPSHLAALLNPEYRWVGIARRGCDESFNTASQCFWTMDFATLAEDLPEDRDEDKSQEPQFSNEAVLAAAEAAIGPISTTIKEDFTQDVEEQDTRIDRVKRYLRQFGR